MCNVFRAGVRAASLVASLLLSVTAWAEPPAAAPRADVHGDPLPNGAVARFGTVRFNHGDPVHSLNFTPDGKTIISEGSGHIRIWDAATGRELGHLDVGKPSHDDQQVLSPDGKTLTMLTQNWGVRGYDAVRFFDLEQRKETRTVNTSLSRNELAIFLLNALSQDGALCALHTRESIRIFDIAASKELYKLPDRDQIRAVTFAGTDQLVTAGKNGHIDVREARTGKSIRQFDNGSPAGVLNASADGRLLAVLNHGNDSVDRHLDKDTVYIWDLATGTRKHMLDSQPKRWYMGAWFSPDAKLVFTYSHNPQGYELTVWDAASGKRLREVAGVGGKAFAVSPDSRQFAVGGSKFDLWDVQTLRRATGEDSHHASAAALHLSPNGDRLVTIGYESISTWDGQSGRRLRSIDLPRHPYSDPDRIVSTDGRLAVTYEGDYRKHQILIWDVATGHRLQTLSAGGQIQCALSPDSSTLAELAPGKEATVRLWDMRTGQERRSFPEPKASWPGRLFFTAEGRVLVVAGRQIVGYDVSSGKELFAWRVQPVAVNGSREMAVPAGAAQEPLAWRSFAMSPDGAAAACILSGGFDNRPVPERVALLDGRTGAVRMRCNDGGRLNSWFEQLVFSRDGRLLASSDGPDVYVWEVATGRAVRVLRGHRGEVRALAFAAGGRRLASAATDSTALVWDLQPPSQAKPDEQAWADLAGDDAERGYAVIWRLSNSPAAVPWLRGQLKPARDAEVKEIVDAIADLDSSSFAVRKKALDRLQKLGQAAALALRAALEADRPAESRRQIERLLAGLSQGPLTGDSLRTVRALSILELAATPDARRLLEELAAGANGAWITDEARQALKRLPDAAK